MPLKTKKQAVSLFGINDCHSPKKSRKNTLNNKKTLKRRTKPFNYNTLEPKMLKVNSLQDFNKILGTDFDQLDDLHKYMKQNKTRCALKVFDTKQEFKFPDYIIEAIK